jgi:hypothetical protein
MLSEVETSLAFLPSIQADFISREFGSAMGAILITLGLKLTFDKEQAKLPVRFLANCRTSPLTGL